MRCERFLAETPFTFGGISRHDLYNVQMDAREELIAARNRLDAIMAEARRMKQVLEPERADARRVRRLQKFWWWAVLLVGVGLGLGLGFLLADRIIDPATIIVPSTGIEV